jgi:hypothetical protein
VSGRGCVESWVSRRAAGRDGGDLGYRHHG